ncbi:hypothetical protein ACKUB1_11915 [Methanospirillum stamsii]|uniref:hypothetical protein n=1 Tax=Methanospirillum stamsii TaxID=1277351 RepID=UPI0015E85DEF|nr:hypothetical protein [Methanospirillum stamsii]
MSGEVDPKENIGKPYKRGMLPYGGATQRGMVAIVVTKEEFDDKMNRLKSIQW